MQYKYKHAVIGGTFDHFHKGHEFFLKKAFKAAEKVTIGLTTSELLIGKTLINEIEDYNSRMFALTEFLKKEKYISRVKVIPLTDIYGNSLSDESIDAIYIVKTGLENSRLINRKRTDIGYRPLKVIVVPLVKDSIGRTISSTQIRKGEIDRTGNNYLIQFKGTKYLELPNELRNKLRIPFGKIYADLDDVITEDRFTISVGDIVTSSLIRRGVTPNISIYDFQTGRKKITDRNILDYLPVPNISIPNRHGTINSLTVNKTYESIKKSMETNQAQSIRIRGEEDLLTLPAILLSPLNAIVIYGIQSVGAIVVEVTEERKREVFNKYLDKFIVKHK